MCRRGFSLIELACVLAIIAILLAGVMLLVSLVQEKNRSADNLREIELIISVSHTLSQGQSSYNSITTQVLAQSSFFPSRWINGAQNGLVDSYGGVVTANGVNNVMNVWFYNLTQQGCENLVTQDFGQGEVVNRNVNGIADTGTNTYGPAIASYYCKPGSNFVGFNFL